MNSKFVMWTVVAMLFMMLIACSDEEDPSSPNNPTNPNTPENAGTLHLKVTDAPIDDANIQAAVITIANIYLDGQKIEGYNKTSIDILAYQQGDTYDLGNFDISADSYESITLELDMASAQDGSVPGCYVMDADGNKHSLITSNGTLQLVSDIAIQEDATSEVILDFDLRKAIRQGNDNMDQYDFVTNTELESSIRVIKGSDHQIVSGTVSNTEDKGDVIVAFLYAKGEFNSETEVSTDGESRIDFPNAISSARLDAQGKFEFHYIPTGEYEIEFASYKYDQEGKVQLDGMVTVNMDNILGSILGGLPITVESDTELEIEATGFIEILN